MLYTTRAIALHYHKYNDKSIIFKAYTQAFGLKTYFVRLKTGMGLGFFQPMTVLELVAYRKDKSNIQNLKEAALAIPLPTIQADVVKSSIAVFMAEVLNHAIKHEEEDEAFFAFLIQSVTDLEHSNTNTAIAPHQFLLDLSRFLGFYPALPPIQPLPYFDLLAGDFCAAIPPHPHFTNLEETPALAAFLTGESQFTRPAREMLLNRLIEFYQIHIEGFGSLKSPHVLKEVLS